jgi:hypothetical protein
VTEPTALVSSALTTATGDATLYGDLSTDGNMFVCTGGSDRFTVGKGGSQRHGVLFADSGDEASDRDAQLVYDAVGDVLSLEDTADDSEALTAGAVAFSVAIDGSTTVPRDLVATGSLAPSQGLRLPAGSDGRLTLDGGNVRFDGGAAKQYVVFGDHDSNGTQLVYDPSGHDLRFEAGSDRSDGGDLLSVDVVTGKTTLGTLNVNAEKLVLRVVEASSRTDVRIDSAEKDFFEDNTCVTGQLAWDIYQGFTEDRVALCACFEAGDQTQTTKNGWHCFL